MIDLDRLRKQIQEAEEEDLDRIPFDDFHDLLFEHGMKKGFMNALLFFQEKKWIIEEYMSALANTSFGEALRKEQEVKNVFKKIDIFDIYEEEEIRKMLATTAKRRQV